MKYLNTFKKISRNEYSVQMHLFTDANDFKLQLFELLVFIIMSNNDINEKDCTLLVRFTDESTVLDEEFYYPNFGKKVDFLYIYENFTSTITGGEVIMKVY
jgi:hypothetical protein